MESHFISTNLHCDRIERRTTRKHAASLIGGVKKKKVPWYEMNNSEIPAVYVTKQIFWSAWE